MGRTASNPYADEFLPCYTGLFGNEYLRAVADAILAPGAQLAGAAWTSRVATSRNFDTLTAQAKVAWAEVRIGALRVAASPYLFDRDGNVLRRATISDQFEFQKRLWEDRKSYADQLVYVNRRIGSVVERLIADSPRPPVILLISDHGPNLRKGLTGPEQHHVRLSNLTAMYLPGAPAGYLPADATPVNHLRRVFNLYFDAGLPILPDRYFVSSFLFPLKLEEVGPRQRDAARPAGFLTKCDPVGWPDASPTGELHRMKHPLEKFACALAVSIARRRTGCGLHRPGHRLACCCR